MLIYWFNSVYPSVFKPYFDTQLATLVELGHAVRTFAFSRGPGPDSKLVADLGLDRSTTYLIGSPRDSLRNAGPVVAAALHSPGRVWQRARAAARAGRGARQGIGFTLRSLGLPKAAPDLLFVNNLDTLCTLRFLKRIYPTSLLAFYYHGGQPAGVPPVRPEDAVAALSSADLVFSNTAFSTHDVIRRGADGRKAQAVPLGFRLEDYPIRSHIPTPGTGVIRAFSLGRLSREKGHHVAIAALRVLQERHGRMVEYHLFGDGPERIRLAELAETQGVGMRVRFHGRVADTDLPGMLADMHMCLQPSLTLGDWSENQACAVQEQFLRGIPVLVSRSGGMPECIPGELKGFMHEEGDAEDLAARINELASLEAGLFSELSASCRVYASREFDARILTGRLLDRIRGALPPAELPGISES